MLFFRRDPDYAAEHVAPMMVEVYFFVVIMTSMREDKCDNDCVLVMASMFVNLSVGLGNLTSAVVAHSPSLRIVNCNNISFLVVGHLFSSSYVAFSPLGLYVLFVILLPKSFHCMFAAKIDRAQLRNFNLPPLHIPQPYQELPPHTIHSPIFPFTISPSHLEIGRIPAVG